MNSKGFLRIMEVVFAILLITGAVLVLLSQQRGEEDRSVDIHEKQQSILHAITQNADLRSDILLEDTDEVNESIKLLIPAGWEFTTTICDLQYICAGEIPLDTTVYVIEQVVASSVTNYGPKKIRFFVWME
jgi:hypothetical protein